MQGKTEGRQIPWESSSLVGDFYFVKAASASPSTTSPTLPVFDPASIELSFWESIKNSSDAEDYKAYIEKYPNGTFVALARNKLRGLEAAGKPASSPTTTPGNPTGAKPNLSAGASPLPLRGFEFDTVTVNSSGSVTSRRKGQGQYFTEDINGVALEMVEIPGGRFMMGSNDYDGEKPQHEVNVPGFYMGKYEVTQAQWRAVASLPRVKIELNPTPSNFKGDDLPVESVSWDEAMEFCARLSKATGREYRLPSEAEWEYACRAGTRTPFAFGETVTPELVNYDGNFPYAQASKGMYREKSTPVGYMGVANAFGLYDMHGNVWEWCLDAWHDTYNNAPTDGSAWERAGDPGKRVLRGGSWNGNAYGSRAAYRGGVTPDLRGNHLGFRVVFVARTQ